MWKYFTNNCLLNASNLDCPAGLCDEKGKQTLEKWKISDQDGAPYESSGVNANSGGGAFRELGGKCLVTHFPVAIQSCLNEALSFHTPTLMHCQGQRLLAHMSHLDSFTLLFQQWDTCVTSLWPSSKIRSPSAPPPLLSQSTRRELKFITVAACQESDRLKLQRPTACEQFQRVWIQRRKHLFKYW